MANRKNTFLIKRSNVAGKVPTAGDLQLGELAINFSDVILYASGTTANSILPIGWDRVARTGDTMTGNLFTPYLSATTVSATTYLNLPPTTFSGGTVTGPTNFTNGLTANTMSATTYYGDGSNLTGISAVATEFVVNCRNQSGSDMYRGQVVYMNGSTGNKPTILLAQANSEMTSARTFGVLKNDIANNGNGDVVTIGSITNLDTRTSATHPFTIDTLSDGQTIYLSPTNAGYITNVKPYAPNHLVYIGKVVRTSPTNGYIEYQIQNGYELDELHDVKITGVTYGDLLTYSAYNGSNVWVNSKTLNGSYTITGNTTIGGQMKATSVSATTISTPSFTANNGGITATTVSATTYYNLPTDIRVTGGTYNAGTATFTNNTGGTFNVTGFSTGSSTFSGGTVSGATTFTNGLTANTISATTYQNLPNSGVLVVPIATSSVSIGTGSNDYYLNFKVPYNLTISKVDFSVSIAGSDSVRIGIYRGQDLTAVLVGQSAGGTVSTLNSVSIVAESGQNLTFSGGSWIVIGVAVGGTTTNLYGSACPSNNLIAWTNTTDSAGGFPANPRSKGGTRTSFPSIEITLA
jgi:hypothetical protein